MDGFVMVRRASVQEKKSQGQSHSQKAKPAGRLACAQGPEKKPPGPLLLPFHGAMHTFLSRQRFQYTGLLSWAFWHFPWSSH
jgi:hypothetical protein